MEKEGGSRRCCAAEINAQNPGARTKKKKQKKRSSQIQMCGGSDSWGGSLLWTARRRITHPHMDAADAGPEGGGGGIRLAGHRPSSICRLIKTNVDQLQETPINSPLLPIILMLLTGFRLPLLRAQVAGGSSRGSLLVTAVLPELSF